MKERIKFANRPHFFVDGACRTDLEEKPMSCAWVVFDGRPKPNPKLVVKLSNRPVFEEAMLLPAEWTPIADSLLAEWAGLKAAMEWAHSSDLKEASFFGDNSSVMGWLRNGREHSGTSSIMRAHIDRCLLIYRLRPEWKFSKINRKSNRHADALCSAVLARRPHICDETLDGLPPAPDVVVPRKIPSIVQCPQCRKMHGRRETCIIDDLRDVGAIHREG